MRTKCSTRDQVRMLLARGYRQVDICRELNLSQSTVHDNVRAILGPSNGHVSFAKIGRPLGIKADISPEARAVIAKEICDDETILACMSRLIAAMSPKGKREAR